MRNRNRVLGILLACGMVLALSACGGHTHSAGGSWSGDLENHWQVCTCGEKVESAAHTLEGEVCTVCGSEIMTYEDGTKQLYVYNEYGECILCAYYGADGTLEFEDLYEYTYDADGNKLTGKTYSDGELLFDCEYARSAGGETYLVKETIYSEDGTWDCNEYDENGNTIRFFSYDADGSVIYGNEYEYSADGSRLFLKSYEGERLSSEQESVFTEDGSENIVRHVYYEEDGCFYVTEYDLYGNESLEAYYDADGNVLSELKFENEYNSDGDLVVRRSYEGDRLAEEAEYSYTVYADGSVYGNAKTTVYHEDGSKTVSESDPENTWSSEIIYAEDGSVIEEIRYEYEVNEEGESVGSKGYLNGRLFREVQSIVGEDGESTGMLWISYEEDGTKTVTEYDEFFDVVKETVYDAAGNVISES